MAAGELLIRDNANGTGPIFPFTRQKISPQKSPAFHPTVFFLSPGSVYFWHMNCDILGMAKRANLSARLQQVGYPFPSGKRQLPVPALYLMQLRSTAQKPIAPLRRLSVAVELNGDKEISHPVEIVHIV